MGKETSDKDAIVQTSRKLGFLLRHSALPDTEGWMDVADLVENYGLTEELIAGAVEQDEKGRYAFSPDKRKIRAEYAHSNHVDIPRQATTPPTFLYHGSATKYESRIVQEGIKPRSRREVHLSTTIDLATAVGSRHGKPIVFAIDAAAMESDGYSFRKANEYVWITDEIPPKYLHKIK